MVTGALKSKVDAVWNAFWTGGIANPIEVIEQITYLLFIRRLDELQLLAENRARLTQQPITKAVFGEGMSEPPGRTPRPLADLRWSRFKNFDPAAMFEVVDGHVFPMLRSMGEQGSSFNANMKDARFTIPTPALLAKVVDLLEAIPMDDTDAKGDIYEYMLSKLATSGTNGQFRTPRHIIRLMVDMTAPKPGDRIVDPAAGTAGFLTVASEYLREHHPEIWADATSRDHFNRHAFSGFDSDATMSRIGSMNLLLHGVEAATVERRDSLAEGVGADDGEFSLVLANPPFAGSVDAESIANDLTRMVKTKKTELLFLALMLRVMKNGGRAAVIVPDGVLFGSSTAHKALRRMLVDDHKLDAVVKLPSGVFKPYAGVSTAILFFTKTSSGGTDHVWFYDVQSDGFSLDDKRTALASSDLPDVLARWQTLQDADSPEADRPRTAQSFLVPRQEIVDAGYDLSLNRYKEVEHDEVEHRDPLEIIAELQALEAEIAAATAALAESLRR